MLSDTELKDLKKSLPRGYFQRIVDSVPFSESTVKNFFKNRTYKIEIHEAALELAKEHLSRTRAVTKRQKAIIHG
tara:strand:- start:6143 stop:6367 length:225 start_codon:yes stop_codon:yes gene_type:complete